VISVESGDLEKTQVHYGPNPTINQEACSGNDGEDAGVSGLLLAFVGMR